MIEPFDTLPEPTLDYRRERELAALWRKSKDAAAIEQLVLNNMRQAVLYARRICRDEFEDGDLISICYKALLRQAKRYDPRSKLNFFTFAKIGVRGDVNRFFQQWDAVKKSKMVPMSSVREFTDSDGGDSCVEQIEKKDDIEFVLRSIRRCCTPKEQTIFALAYFGELGFHEIARLLNVSRSAIQFAHARALDKVRSDCKLTETLCTL